MERANRQKLLGQYFSGERIAAALFDLLGKPTGKSVIDPMCGQADLLIPFLNGNTIKGIELDKEAYDKAIQLISKEHLIEGNAFGVDTLCMLALDGYDVVITNPPFIRRENYRKATELIEGNLPLEQICYNLENYVKRVKTLNQEQKEKVCSYLKSASGLSDIASFSIILCMVITKVGGHLALVVPNTWLGREYSAPVVELLKEFFEIEFIVNDANSAWFEGIAQVKTALVVAKRTNESKLQNNITIMDVYRSSLSKESLFSFLGKEQSILDFIKKRLDIPYKCEIQTISQNDFAVRAGIDATSKLKPFCNEYTNFTTIESLDISCGQGFRSGANACFVFDKVGNQRVSKIGSLNVGLVEDFFIPIIQNQKILDKSYSVDSSDKLAVLLTIDKKYARISDINKLDAPLRDLYIPVPHVLDSYISISESYKIKGTPVPQLSAVRTNERHTDNSVRFWYHFPDFAPRHRGNIFIPRVNGSAVVARMNPNSFIVDANFITFWNNSSKNPSEWILALLNSTWFSIMCEESGVVMGGGALKVDAVQLKKMPIPPLDKKDIQKLGVLGKNLKFSKTDISDSIIFKIDKILFGKVGANDKRTLRKILQIRNEYIARRI
jgi:predicted RNA methylase